jgi:hypothetical protein
LSPTKLGDRYHLDELTFADTAATGGNAPKAARSRDEPYRPGQAESLHSPVLR